MPLASPAPVLQIVEVLGSIEQGLTQPLKCRAEDGHLYYVKGQQTNRSSLWHEWICGHLANALGLPVPPFSLVQLDEVLLEEISPAWRRVGSLPSFGSRQHPTSSWLELAMAGKVNQRLQRDVLVFDWWVRNADRSLGNPNLLWDPQPEALVVIDHNLAFDAEFNPAAFAANHVFGGQWQPLIDDLVTRDEYERRLVAALPVAREACDCAPQEWLWENSEFDVPTRFDRDAALAVLARCTGPELWRMA
jgi:hypothetical protein